MPTTSEISQVREAVDIVRVIGEYVRLARAAKDWKGLCPFHQERTPSFIVHPAGWYKCFGCGASGDVFTFVQHFEGVPFPEAVRSLAERCGIPLTDLTPEQRRAYAAARQAAEALPVDDWWHGLTLRIEQIRATLIEICNELWPDCPTAGFEKRRRWCDRILAAKPHQRRMLYAIAARDNAAATAAITAEGRDDLRHARLAAEAVVNWL